MFRVLKQWWRCLTGRRGRAEAPEEEATRPAGEKGAQPEGEGDARPAVGETPESVAPEPVNGVAVAAQRTRRRREDDLTVIKGIGPATQRRLQVAGIRSYEDLARATPEEVHRALLGSRRGASVEQWIRRARQLSGTSDTDAR